jgi:hypothetical protein
MFTETSFTEWLAQVKIEFAKAGLEMEEDEGLLELVHMECMEARKSVAEFVQEAIVEQKGG